MYVHTHVSSCFINATSRNPYVILVAVSHDFYEQILRFLVFWDVGWVAGYVVPDVSKERVAFTLKGWRAMKNVTRSSETSRTTYPATQLRSPQDRNLRSVHCENLTIRRNVHRSSVEVVSKKDLHWLNTASELTSTTVHNWVRYDRGHPWFEDRQ